MGLAEEMLKRADALSLELAQAHKRIETLEGVVEAINNNDYPLKWIKGIRGYFVMEYGKKSNTVKYFDGIIKALEEV